MTPQHADDPGPGGASSEALLAVLEVDEPYRSLFTHNPHAALSFDLGGSFTDVNPAAELISGYTRDELCTKHFADVVHPDDLSPATATFRAAVNQEPGRIELRILRADGGCVDLNVTAIPVVVGGEVIGVYGIAEDITDSRRLREELVHSQREAQEASATKTLFLANMSHEVRTPLTSVLAAAELLREADLDDHADHLVRMIERSGERLLRLVTDILDVSKLGAGTLDLVEDWFDPHAMVAEIVESMGQESHDKGLRSHCEVSPDLPDKLWGDSLRVSQVLTNLVANAVKFTDSGDIGLTVDPVDPIATTDGVVQLRLQVSDTGIGIATEALDELFESFAQADPTDTRAYGGAGLGLAICRDLVHLMGGSITAQSVVGRGSTFTAVLPLRTSPPAGPQPSPASLPL